MWINTINTFSSVSTYTRTFSSEFSIKINYQPQQRQELLSRQLYVKFLPLGSTLICDLQERFWGECLQWVVVNIYCLASVGHLPLRGKNWLLSSISYSQKTSYINSPQTVYLLTVKNIFLSLVTLSVSMDCCFLINFEFMWCYVFILWLYLSFLGVCVRVAGLRVQAAVTQQTLICFYVASIKKGFITVCYLFFLSFMGCRERLEWFFVLHIWVNDFFSFGRYCFVFQTQCNRCCLRNRYLVL